MGAFFNSFLFHEYMILVLFSSTFYLSQSFSPSCKLRKQFFLNGLHQNGDVILGGLMEVHYTSIFPEWTFTSEPKQPTCKG